MQKHFLKVRFINHIQIELTLNIIIVYWHHTFDNTTNPFTEATSILEFLHVEMNSSIKQKLKKAFSTSINISKSNVVPKKISAANNIAGSLLTELKYQI